MYSTGDHSADVSEGTGPAHARLQYEWTNDTVRSVSKEGNAEKPGAVWQMKVRRRDGGGSHIDVHVEIEPSGLLGFVFDATVRLNGGPRFFERTFLKTVAIPEAESSS